MEYAQCELRLKYSKVLRQSALGILCKSNENVIISRISWYNIHSTKIVLIIFNTITYCSVCNVDICHPYTVQKLHIAFHLLSVYFCIFMVMFVYTRQSQNSSSTCTNCFEVKRLKCLSNSIKTYTFECEFYNSVLSKLFTMDMETMDVKKDRSYKKISYSVLIHYGTVASVLYFHHNFPDTLMAIVGRFFKIQVYRRETLNHPKCIGVILFYFDCI